ncbi:MAG: LysR family transcriptional regulator [Psychrobacillus sp.]
MNIKQLIYFLAIAEEGSITKAADRLHMAQPPLSKQLKMLEIELNIELFERNKRNLRITEAGKQLQYRAKQIIDLTETTIRELKDYDEGIHGTLRIGTIASAGDTLLPENVFSFHQKYPNIRFHIKESNTQEILDMLKNGIIDIGIVRTPIDSDFFDSILFPEEPMVAATTGTPFWNEKQPSITVADLAGKPLLVLNRYEDVMIKSCQKAGFEPDIIGKIDDTRTIMLWANKGMGIAIVQRDWPELMKNNGLKYKEIAEPLLVTQPAIVWMKNRYMSSASRHFLETFVVD